MMWIARWLRQSVQCLSALACVLLAGTQWIPTALAQDYPVRPVRIIAPFPPGGGADIILRALGPRMAQALGQPVIIDNHAGGGGTIGTKLAAAATPDGYTLVLGLTGTLAINPGLYPDLSYDPQKDFTPVALLATGANVLVAHPGLGIRSIDELIAYAKLHPGKLTYASSGVGGAPHLAGVLLGSMADVELVHIPYKGGAQATADLLGGHVSLMFAGLGPAISNIQSGKLRALGVASPGRSSLLPDVPAIGESLPGFSAVTWFGILAPSGTPAPIVARLSGVILEIAASRDFARQLEAEGYEVSAGSPQSFATLIASDKAKWADIIRTTGATIQ